LLFVALSLFSLLSPLRFVGFSTPLTLASECTANVAEPPSTCICTGRVSGVDQIRGGAGDHDGHCD